MQNEHKVFGKEVKGQLESIKEVTKHKNLAILKVDGQEYYYLRRDCGNRGNGLEEYLKKGAGDIEFIALNFTLAKGLEWLDCKLESVNGRLKPATYNWEEIPETISGKFAFGIGRDLKQKVEVDMLAEERAGDIVAILREEGLIDFKSFKPVVKSQLVQQRINKIYNTWELSKNDRNKVNEKLEESIQKGTFTVLEKGDLGCGNILNNDFGDDGYNDDNIDGGLKEGLNLRYIKGDICNYFFRYKALWGRPQSFNDRIGYRYYFLASPLVEPIPALSDKASPMFCYLGEGKQEETEQSVRVKLERHLNEIEKRRRGKVSLGYNDKHGFPSLNIDGHSYQVSIKWGVK